MSHPPPRHHYPGHYRHRVWAVNSLTVTALGLIPLSAMAAAGQRAGDAITPAVQAVPPPPTAVTQPTGVLELITAPSTTATTARDDGKAPGDTETPPRVCRCQPRRAPQTAIPAPTTPPQAPASTSTPTRTSAPASSSLAPSTTPPTTTTPASTPPSPSPSTTPSTTAPPVTSSTVQITSTEALPTPTETSAE